MIQGNGSTLTTVRICTSSGVSPVNFTVSLNLVSGVECEIELNYNLTTGQTRIFKNGVLIGSDLSGTGTRSSSIGYFVIGSSYDGRRSDFWINDFVVFTTVQHTANYTPGYTLPETIYSASNVTCPEMEYTGAGTLISADDFTTVESGAPRFTIQIGRSGNYLYWNGAAWAVSDGTYAKANTAAEILANAATFTTVRINLYIYALLHSDGIIQAEIETLTITYDYAPRAKPA